MRREGNMIAPWRKPHGGRRATIAAAVVLTVISGLLAACSGASNSSGQHPTTVTWAESANFGPQWILPIYPGQYFTVQDQSMFEYLLYPPLYNFGSGSSPSINYADSLGQPPQYNAASDEVTIKLNHWKWSDGTPVTSRDITFWINLIRANRDQWGAYTPGGFPDNIVKVTTNGPYELTLKLDQSYNHEYFTLNQLSQITPVPQHVWDKTSATGPVGNYDETAAGAQAVFKVLDAASLKTSTYATNPLWKVVDGPWKLTGFTSTQQATFQANPNYSGPDKPTFKTFVEVPYTTVTAETNALLAGQLDVGYIMPQESHLTGELKAKGYSTAQWPIYGFESLFLNYNNPTVGSMFKQLYIRQALQYLINEPQWLKAGEFNTGQPTYGPVVNGPANLVSSADKVNNYPFNPAKARALLASHGWTVRPGGQTTCAHPGSGAGECGAGIAAGAPLTFTALIYSTAADQAIELAGYKTVAATLGIDIIVKTVSNVYADAGRCTSNQSGCSWQIADWGGAVFGGANYYPLGAGYFYSTSSNNHENYVNATADKLDQEGRKPGGSIYPWENFISVNLPELWVPNAIFQIVAARSNLKGVFPNNPLLSIYPQRWSYTS
jgi:peptide/nickel transport system substrate-binding protein